MLRAIVSGFWTTKKMTNVTSITPAMMSGA
jgi:hypothetical protein